MFFDLKGVVTIKRRLIVSFLTVCILLLFNVTAYAASPVIPKTNFNYRGTDIAASIESIYRTDHAYFKDEADLLTSSSEKSIWEKLQATSDYLNVNIAVFIGGNYRTEDETVNFTINGTSSIFGSYSDTLFLYLDFEGYSPAYDYIRAFNRAEDIYPDTKRNKILNVMYQSLPKSNEPIYEDAVRQAITNGLDEIKSQGYVNSVGTSQSQQNRPARQVSRTDTFANIGEIIQKIPSPVIFGGIALIVVLVIISSISKSIKRRFGRNNSYYNSSNYYDPHSNYYNSGSYHNTSYHRKPPRSRPSRSSRSSHRSSSSSSSHSSGSGHYR